MTKEISVHYLGEYITMLGALDPVQTRLGPRNCGVQLRGARVVWKENFATFCYILLLRGVIGWGISPRNCAPQLHPARVVWKESCRVQE